MIYVYVVLLLLVNLCCFLIRWTKFGIFFTAVIILNQTVRRLLINRKNSSTSTVSSFITSTHTLLWCLSYFYVLPVYFLYPVSTHKFTNTFTTGASVISLNLACIALLLLELNKSPLRPFYSSVLRPFLSALLKYVWPSVTSTDIRLPLNQNENQCKDIVEKSAGNRDSGTEELAGKKSALPDESSTRKRQMYQTLKCMMAMKRRIRKYRESKLLQSQSQDSQVTHFHTDTGSAEIMTSQNLERS